MVDRQLETIVIVHCKTGSVSGGAIRFDCRKRGQFGEPLRPRWRELGGQGVGLTLALEREGERDFPVDALNPKP